MAYQENQQIQDAIAIHLATGKYATPEEVVLVALQHLADEDAEYQACLADMPESIADEQAGRLKSLSVVAEEIRSKHGFRDPT